MNNLVSQTCKLISGPESMTVDKRTKIHDRAARRLDFIYFKRITSANHMLLQVFRYIVI